MTTVTFVDTSVLCEMLQVPGNSSEERGAEVRAEADRRSKAGERFVIPVTSLIETGNHIAQSIGNRHGAAGRFVAFLRAAIADGGPWRVLETRLDGEFLAAVCDGDSTGMSFEALAAAKVGAGDVAILVERDQFLAGSALGRANVWTSWLSRRWWRRRSTEPTWCSGWRTAAWNAPCGRARGRWTGPASDVALYGEWMFLTHSVAYDRLPSYLVALDLWRPDIGFLSVEGRDTACTRSGLTTPPRLWQGVAGDIGAVERLLGPSAWGPAPMEGLVVRSLERPDQRAKLLTTAFKRIDDDEWRGGRPRNGLAHEAASWR